MVWRVQKKKKQVSSRYPLLLYSSSCKISHFFYVFKINKEKRLDCRFSSDCYCTSAGDIPINVK